MAGHIFERILCGVDGSPESLEAARQSDILLSPAGKLTLVAVVDPMQAIHLGVALSGVHAARHVAEEIEQADEAAGLALERARAEVTRASDVEIVEAGGSPVSCLLGEIASRQASLVVVGTHGLGRVAGALLGSVATGLLHRATCSVLVARKPAAGGVWSPKRIVVGVDDSPSAKAAVAACGELQSRFDSELRPVTIGGKRPAHGLIEAAADEDLLAVGSRSTHHALGLGSVSEHVAVHAPCSVLVVRASAPADDH
jgi:nucleotide-binding universal stress UspA family protein